MQKTKTNNYKMKNMSIIIKEICNFFTVIGLS